MSQNLISAEDVKKALNIDSFRNITKDKISEFISLITSMDREVAINIIEQFPAYAEYAGAIIIQLNTLCDNALKSNDASQRDAIEAYKKLLDDLGEILKKDNLTADERKMISDKMLTVADRIAAKDTENKEFITNMLKFGVPILGVAIILGATILQVNVRGTKIPSLKK